MRAELIKEEEKNLNIARETRVLNAGAGRGRTVALIHGEKDRKIGPRTVEHVMECAATVLLHGSSRWAELIFFFYPWINGGDGKHWSVQN